MSPRVGEVVLASQSDERLVKLARAGHERAFAVIVERYRPELSAFAGRLSSDEKGEDIVQQAFLSAFAALRAGADVKHLRGWLYRIVRNAAARSRAPLCIPLDGAAASGESVEEVVQQRDLAISALAEVARLPTRQRQAIVGTALDGRGRAEVAISMGVSEGAVRQLVHRARARIRTAVTAVTPWPLVRWVAASGSGGGGPANVTAGVGAASSAGVALKLGIVLASGAIATGVAVDVHRSARPQRPDARAASHGVDRRAGRSGEWAPTAALLAPPPVGRPEALPTADAVDVVFHRLRVRRGRDGAGAKPERHRPGGAGRDRGTDRGNGGGSSFGDGHTQRLRDGGTSGSGARGGSDPAAPGSLQGGSGFGGGSARGGDAYQGRDGSPSGPQAVVAGVSGPTRGGDRGPSSSGWDAGSGTGSGSQWGASTGPGADTAPGSGWSGGSADVGSGPGSGAPSSAAGGSTH